MYPIIHYVSSDTSRNTYKDRYWDTYVSPYVLEQSYFINELIRPLIKVTRKNLSESVSRNILCKINKVQQDKTLWMNFTLRLSRCTKRLLEFIKEIIQIIVLQKQLFQAKIVWPLLVSQYVSQYVSLYVSLYVFRDVS